MRPLVFGIVLTTIVASLGSASCKGREPVSVCVDTFRTSYIGAEIRDATTGVAPTGVAWLIVRGDGLVDSVKSQSFATVPYLYAQWDASRFGTYDATVRSAGYRDWVQTGNTLSTDGCGPTAVLLRASLQRP